MTMDVTPTGQITPGALPAGGRPQPTAVGPAPPRTGAFSALHTRWLVLWALVGGLLFAGLTQAAVALGLPVSDELTGVLLYLPVIAWIWFMVVRRGGVHLGAMLRWPQLGSYWFVVAGLLVVQFLFSLAAITLTTLVAPWMFDSLEGVGEGNLALATLGLVVLPPLVEEVVFRGVLLERFSVKWRVGVAVVLSAVFFGILHADPVGAGMFGLITGLLYLRTGSLWPGIIIHFVNNLVALVATRLAGSDTGTDALEVSEALVSVGVLLLLSLPFLVWFIRANWPARGTPTPYQLYEMQVGLPPRSFDSVAWSGVHATVRVQVTSTHVEVSDEVGAPIARLPLDRVHAVYPANVPGGTEIVLLLNDGSWTTLRAPQGDAKMTDALSASLTERVAFARRPVAGQVHQ
jgi:membrane protease YdiL (CAAX protease family)